MVNRFWVSVQQVRPLVKRFQSKLWPKHSLPPLLCLWLLCTVCVRVRLSLNPAIYVTVCCRVHPASGAASAWRYYRAQSAHSGLKVQLRQDDLPQVSYTSLSLSLCQCMSECRLVMVVIVQCWIWSSCSRLSGRAWRSVREITAGEWFLVATVK